MSSKLYGAIEAGGTKFVCALGTGPEEMRQFVHFPTTTPEETIARAVDFFISNLEAGERLAAIGVASFGPIDPNPHSQTFGFITSTPKPGWSNFNVVDAIAKTMPVAIYFDTDVNGAALGEWRWGAAQGLDTFIYLTIGTGLGGGGMSNGKLMHGLVHPEMGHIPMPHDWNLDPFPGICPFHGDCWEGMAAGPALEKRWGARAENLPPDHPAWELEAHYLAVGLVSLICSLSPQRIILGGGVMQQTHLLPLVREKVVKYLNGYVQSSLILDKIDEYIILPALGSRAGVLGALALAMQEA
jgi:fructokinase